MLRLLMVVVFIVIVHADHDVTFYCDWISDDSCVYQNVVISENTPEHSLKFASRYQRRNRKRSIYMKDSKLYYVPAAMIEGGEDLKSVIMGDSGIHVMQTASFRNAPYLQFLNLSHNHIQRLESAVFSNRFLSNIDLSFNNIDTIHENAFSGADSLFDLTLSNNVIKDIPSNLAIRRKLQLDNNKIEILTSGFLSKSYSLQVLQLSDNLIREIDENAFFNLTQLTILNLSKNQINFIHEKTFQSIKSGILYLNDNKLTELSGNLFAKSGLIEINLANNQINSINETVFTDNEKLQRLILTNNSLTSLPVNLFTKLSALQSLYLDFNKIQTVVNIDFGTSLTSINLSNNEIFHVEWRIFAGLRSLQEIHMQNNRLTIIDLSPVAAKHVHFQHNMIDTIKVGPTNLMIDASHNRLAHFLADGSMLTQLYLSNNSISDLSNITSIQTMTHLDVSFNPLGAVSHSTFSKMSNLIFLNLESSRISELDYGTFSSQLNLQILDISYNNLRFIDLDILDGLKVLHQLMIDGNNLTSIKYEDFKEHHPLLGYIGLADNNWDCPYLVTMLRKFDKDRISILNSNSRPTVNNHSNVHGIVCMNSNEDVIAAWKTPVKHFNDLPNLNSSEFHHLLQNFVNEEDFNKLKENMSQEIKKMMENLTAKLARLDDEVYQSKSELIKLKLSVLASNASTNSSQFNFDLKTLIEHLNNMTLQKQQLNHDILNQKVYEQSFRINQIFEKLEENSKRIRNNYTPMLQQSTSYTDSKTTIIIVSVLTNLALVAFLLYILKFRYMSCQNPYRGRADAISNNSRMTLEQSI